MKMSCACNMFEAVSLSCPTPDIGRFMARAAGVTVKEAALAKTSLSLVAHAPHGFTDGRGNFFALENVPHLP